MSAPIARAVASLGPVGRFPVSPGSAGSLVALAAGAALLRWSAWALVPAALAATVAGLWAVRRCGAADDPGWVVIDEVAGQWIALLGVPAPTPGWLIAAFVLFRAIDIGKPGPVGWADRRHTSWGVMGDDLIAGAITALLVRGGGMAFG